MKIFVIGSLQQEKEIEEISKYFKEQKGFIVKHVKKEPNKDPETLIIQAFQNIKNSDLIIAVKKHDDSFGIGTLYEIVFSRFMKKEIIEVSIKDIEKPRENKGIDFSPKPLPAYLSHDGREENCCPCYSEEEYMNFLFREYRAETVCRVKREEEENKKYFESLKKDDLKSIALMEAILSISDQYNRGDE